MSAGNKHDTSCISFSQRWASQLSQQNRQERDGPNVTFFLLVPDLERGEHTFTWRTKIDLHDVFLFHELWDISASSSYQRNTDTHVDVRGRQGPLLWEHVGLLVSAPRQVSGQSKQTWGSICSVVCHKSLCNATHIANLPVPSAGRLSKFLRRCTQLPHICRLLIANPGQR